MLKEWEAVRQVPEDGYRRWFTDHDFDLIVWYPDESRSEISGFQLCYDKSRQERALTWKRSEGYLHNKIDDGETPFGNKRTPILVPDGMFARDRVKQQFLRAAKEVDREIVDFVVAKLDKFERTSSL
ncbi:hypothetical protein [Salinispira pacifica]